jgi:hypothetical protein
MLREEGTVSRDTAQVSSPWIFFAASVFSLWLMTNVVFAFKAYSDGSLPVVLRHPHLPWLLPALEVLLVMLATVIVRSYPVRSSFKQKDVG